MSQHLGVDVGARALATVVDETDTIVVHPNPKALAAHEAELGRLEKASLAIAKQAGRVCVETLSVAGMVRNGRLAKDVSDAAMSQLLAHIRHKCEALDRTLVEAPRGFPSTKTCSACGGRNEPGSALGYDCGHCGRCLQRDLNAAKNLRDYGLEAALGTPPLSPAGERAVTEATVGGMAETVGIEHYPDGGRTRSSVRAAIDAKCRDCIHDPLDRGTWRAQVGNCTSYDCPLWPLRPMPEGRTHPYQSARRASAGNSSGDG